MCKGMHFESICYYCEVIQPHNGQNKRKFEVGG